LEAQLKDDPAAQWRVLGYWRANPDVGKRGDAPDTSMERTRLTLQRYREFWNTQKPAEYGLDSALKAECFGGEATITPGYPPLPPVQPKLWILKEIGWWYIAKIWT